MKDAVDLLNDEISRLRAELAMIEDERGTAAGYVKEELAQLARLALHGSRRDVEMYVHRLAYRHRGTPLGVALQGYDVVPGVSLRSATS